MSHFYGTLKGTRGEATRCGTKTSGLVSHAASWNGAVRTSLYFNDTVQEDWCRVELVPWQANGEYRLLYHGPVGRYVPVDPGEAKTEGGE